MPRPRKCRFVKEPPSLEGFIPFGADHASDLPVVLLFEEYEALRLADYEGLAQADAAEKMEISRPTFTRLYEKARRAVATALIEARPLHVSGGNFTHAGHWYRCGHCGKTHIHTEKISQCPHCGLGMLKSLACRSASADCRREMCRRVRAMNPGNSESKECNNHYMEDRIMKIAVPTRENRVDDHFGHCAYYTIFSIDAARGVSEKETLPSPQGCGCKSGIASTLAAMGVTLMLAGNMGEGARNVLESHRIRVVRGCRGPVDEVVAAYLKGELNDSGESCREHGDEGHVCGHDQ